MIEISGQINFDATTNRQVAALKYGKEWPIVYLLFNDDEVYVGETVDAYHRFAQHYDNPERRSLTDARIISSETFNKSVILDLESFLISHISADGRFKKLQNGNAGQQQHNYYQRDMYEKQFSDVWKQLQKFNLATKSLHEIENSNIFKYSPYKSLTSDQYSTCFDIVNTLAQDISKGTNSTFIVKGGPGTGKTVLAIYLMKLLTTQIKDDTNSEDETLIENLQTIHKALPQLKIGLVISMENLRNIVKDTFRATYGLESSMVLKPNEVASTKEKFDILIIDEAHRLKAARNMAGFELRHIREHNLDLGLDEDNGTQLDWILKKSKHQIFFYDSRQSIKRTDVDAARFKDLEQKEHTHILTLTSQLRCGKEGKAYVDYIDALFSPTPPQPRKFSHYDLRLFDDVRKMTDLIRQKNQEPTLGLCRNVAGYAWPWSTKNKIHPENSAETNTCITNGLYDIDISGEKYIWNVKFDGWINSPNAINEIGCIHTIQGFDLNYAGVIIGNELRYNLQTNSFELDKKNYFDPNGKAMTSDEDLLQYILNIYTVLCTRGIHGTYIYACDPGLREYLKRYIK